jgi:phage recombination protein Bet
MTTTGMVVSKKNSLAAKFAAKFSVDEAEVMGILKATAFKQREGSPAVTDAQVTALMIVADQYGLNPWTKEIYAYPDKQNGIVPVVGVDGWSRIINEHPMMDGIEFNYSEETTNHKGKNCPLWIDGIITRKDRAKPIVVREYFDEVVRSVSFATPWDSHPKRMHRHKTLIQTARVAFGFAGIYDEDEAERILEKDITPQGETLPPVQEYVNDADFDAGKAKFKVAVEGNKKTKPDLIVWIESKGKLLTEAQKAEINSWGITPEPQTVENEATQPSDNSDFLNDYKEGEK